MTYNPHTFGTLLAYSITSRRAHKPAKRQKRGETIMVKEPISIAHTARNVTLRRELMLSFIALVFALTIFPGKAHAQVIGNLEVAIPSQFHAGDTKLPPGKHIIHTIDSSELTFMEISSVDGHTSALLKIRDTESNSTPAKSELVFNKYGDQYFLEKVFDEGNSDGSRIEESRYKTKVSEAAGSPIHVAAHRKGLQRNLWPAGTAIPVHQTTSRELLDAGSR
jgi:hypothetical protein